MSDPTNQPPQTPPEATDETDDALERKQRLLDRFRGTGVGVEDPNLGGDHGGVTADPPVADDEGGPAVP
jgi:hypothetical protein